MLCSVSCTYISAVVDKFRHIVGKHTMCDVFSNDVSALIVITVYHLNHVKLKKSLILALSCRSYKLQYAVLYPVIDYHSFF